MANLSEAILGGADLSGANLSGANLHGCNVSSSSFSAGTVITQEQLAKTVAVPPEKPPIFMGDVRDAKTKAPLARVAAAGVNAGGRALLRAR